MIRLDTKYGITHATVWSEPPTIYLDTWALDLFSTDQGLRTNFFDLFRDRGTLALSLMSVVEIGGHAAQNRPELRSFLEAIGPYWVPLTIDPFAVMNAQETSQDHLSACLSTAFLSEYFSSEPGGDLSLVRVVDWTRGTAGAELKAADKSHDICQSVRHWRTEYATDAKVLDTKWKLLPFNPQAPMRPIYNAFMRLCIKESFSFTVNDARDLQHAVVSANCADMALLDNRWAEYARKVQNQIKIPAGFQKIYETRLLPQFLTDLAAYPVSRGLGNPPM